MTDIVVQIKNYRSQKDTVVKFLYKIKQKGFDDVLVTHKVEDLFVFCKCKDERIEREIHREYINDLLKGIGKYSSTSELATATSLTLSERLRYLQKAFYPVFYTSLDLDKSNYFLLHDKNFNREWLNKLNSKYLLEAKDFDEIRENFGHAVALYFEFLQFYFLSLIVPSLFSVLLYVFGNGKIYSTVYAFMVCLWGLVFVEVWTSRERELAIRWGIQNCSKENDIRPEFMSNENHSISITDMWRRTILSNLTLFGLSLILVVLVVIIFFIQVVIDSVFDDGITTFIPSIIFVLLFPKFNQFYCTRVKELTTFENHRTIRSFNASHNQKLFLSNSIVNFSAPLLYGMIFVPFGSWFLKHVQKFYTDQVHDIIIKPELFQNQVIYYITAGQVLDFFSETIIPVVWRRIYGGANGSLEQSQTTNPSVLQQSIQESELPMYNVNTDYSEMVLQYGYVVLFSCVFPLVPLFSLVNNFIEIRSDAFKICFNCSRPVPSREESIGRWLRNLEYLTWFSFIANAVWTSVYTSDRAFEDPILWLTVLIWVFCWEHLYFVLKKIVNSIVCSLPSKALEQSLKESEKRSMEMMKDWKSPTNGGTTLTELVQLSAIDLTIEKDQIFDSITDELNRLDKKNEGMLVDRIREMLEELDLVDRESNVVSEFSRKLLLLRTGIFERGVLVGEENLRTLTEVSESEDKRFFRYLEEGKLDEELILEGLIAEAVVELFKVSLPLILREDEENI